MPEIIAITKSKSVLSDSELCNELGISYSTLYNHLVNGPPTTRHENDPPDVRKIDYVVRGGRRWWLKSSVKKFKKGEL